TQGGWCRVHRINTGAEPGISTDYPGSCDRVAQESDQCPRLNRRDPISRTGSAVRFSEGDRPRTRAERGTKGWCDPRPRRSKPHPACPLHPESDRLHKEKVCDAQGSPGQCEGSGSKTVATVCWWLSVMHPPVQAKSEGLKALPNC